VTPAQWARVLDAGRNAPDLVRHSPPGDAIVHALAAMAEECRKIAEETE
jgi:hypothetical protein